MLFFLVCVCGNEEGEKEWKTKRILKFLVYPKQSSRGTSTIVFFRLFRGWTLTRSLEYASSARNIASLPDRYLARTRSEIQKKRREMREKEDYEPSFARLIPLASYFFAFSPPPFFQSSYLTLAWRHPCRPTTTVAPRLLASGLHECRC